MSAAADVVAARVVHRASARVVVARATLPGERDPAYLVVEDDRVLCVYRGTARGLASAVDTAVGHVAAAAARGARS